MMLFVERKGLPNIKIEVEDAEWEAAMDELIGAGGPISLAKVRGKNGRCEAIDRSTIARVFTLTDEEITRQKEERARKAEALGWKPEQLNG